MPQIRPSRSDEVDIGYLGLRIIGSLFLGGKIFSKPVRIDATLEQ